MLVADTGTESRTKFGASASVSPEGLTLLADAQTGNIVDVEQHDLSLLPS